MSRVGAVAGPVSGRSLAVRVTVVAVIVVSVALVVIGAAVELSLGAQLRRDQDARLDDRTARASLLLATGTPATALPGELGGQGVRAVVVDAAGVVVAGGPGPGRGAWHGPRDGPDRVPHRDGDRGLDRALDPGGDPERGDDGRERFERDPDRLVRVLSLPSGGRLVLGVDPEEYSGVLGSLRAVLLVVGGVGIVATAVALLVGVRVALRPLASMAALARDIAGGDRGRRLHPARTDTEIGRTAAAFDDMLDALEAAQARAESAADEARRSESTTRRFLSDAAHELRTPITGMQTLAETLVRRPDTALERRERIATTLVRETRRAGSLVADMLELARIEGGPVLERRAVDLTDLVAAEVERVALVAPSMAVHVVTAGPVTAWADPARVTQILANLLDNAHRHGPADGRVVVDVVADGPVATVVVTDQGPGVPAPERERVFDRLVRLDDARGRDAGGAGLGLAIARALARAHGGDLVAEEPAEPGARFRLSLPTGPP